MDTLDYILEFVLSESKKKKKVDFPVGTKPAIPDPDEFGTDVYPRAGTSSPSSAWGFDRPGFGMRSYREGKLLPATIVGGSIIGIGSLERRKERRGLPIKRVREE